MPSQRVLEAEDVDSQNRVLDGPRKSGEKREVTGLRGQSNQLAQSLDAPVKESEDLLEVRVGCQSCGATLTVSLSYFPPFFSSLSNFWCHSGKSVCKLYKTDASVSISSAATAMSPCCSYTSMVGLDE